MRYTARTRSIELAPRWRRARRGRRPRAAAPLRRRRYIHRLTLAPHGHPVQQRAATTAPASHDDPSRPRLILRAATTSARRCRSRRGGAPAIARAGAHPHDAAMNAAGAAGSGDAQG